MEKPSWFRTIFVQVSLCFVLYLALNLGQPQKPIQRNRSGNRALDLYFISVRGGFRPLKQQTHLLKLMDKVAKAYNVSFVVNTSELGEDDPLMQNGTAFFSSLKVPWYTICLQISSLNWRHLHHILMFLLQHLELQSMLLVQSLYCKIMITSTCRYTTRTTKGHGVCCFLEQIKLPYGKTLDIVGVDTGSLQDLMLRGSSSEIGHSQLHWLTRTLEAISGNWRIVVGFHQLVACEENNEQMEAKQLYELLHHTFVRFGVNAYLSGHDCTKHVRPGNIAYIGNLTSREKEPYSATVSGQPALNGELVNGFLLHRVSAIEIATYFISSAGEIVHEIVLQHRGKEVM